MLNEIIKGVSMKLNAAFGDAYKIYYNDVRQGLEKPCFFLAVLNPTITPRIGGQYMSRNPLDIQFIPADETQNDEMYATAWGLMEALEFIALPNGDLLHGTGMSYEAVDGVLHFFVSYNLPLRKPVEEVAMEILDADVGTTKG